MIEKKVSEVEDRSVEITQSEEKRGKTELQVLVGTCVTIIPQREERKTIG